jgi:hypothetical protein
MLTRVAAALSGDVDALAHDIAQLDDFTLALKVTCAVPIAASGVNLDALSGAQTGNRRTATCHAGHHTASSEMRCFVDEVFRGGQPVCNPYKCPGEDLTFTDSHGFSGTLSFPETINARLNNQHTHTIQCPNTHEGSITRTCGIDAETWTESGSCVEKVCPAINVNIGGTNVYFSEQGQRTSTTTKACPSGYNGDVTVDCVAASSTFSTSNSCVRTCSGLAESGNANGCAASTEGNTCTQSCNQGYEGSATSRTCGTDGSWSGSAPSCAIPAPAWTSLYAAKGGVGLHLAGYPGGGDVRDYGWACTRTSIESCKDFCDSHNKQFCSGYTLPSSYNCAAGKARLVCWAGDHDGMHYNSAYYTWAPSNLWEKTGRRLVESEESYEAVAINTAAVQEFDNSDDFFKHATQDEVRQHLANAYGADVVSLILGN